MCENITIKRSELKTRTSGRFIRSHQLGDYDAYMKAYYADPVGMKYLYEQLVLAHGSLHLRKGLFSETKIAVDSILESIKNQTSR